MKFRRFSKEELAEMKQEFDHFLLANGILSDEWERLNRMAPKEALKVVDHFSDLVFSKVLERVRFIEIKKARKWEVCFCDSIHIYQITLSLTEKAQIDLRADNALARLMRSHQSHLLYEVKQEFLPYNEDRELDIFKLIEEGGLIAKEKDFLLAKSFLSFHYN